MHYRDRVFLLVVSMTLYPGVTISDDDPDTIPLKPGVAVTASFSDHQEKRYRVFAPVAGHWRFSVDQYGLGVELSIKREDGTVATVDGLTGRYLSDAHVEFVKHASYFDLTVRSGEKTLSPGHLTILAERLPGKTAADRRRIEAKLATASANHYVVEGNAKSYETADSDYDKAVKIWRTLDDPLKLADALYRADASKRKLGDNDAALAYLHEAQPLYRKVGNSMVEGQIANIIGLIHLYRSEYEAAELAFDAALEPLADTTSHTYAGATVRNNLCLLKHYRGNVYEAVDCYNQVLETFVRLNELQRVAVLHNNFADSDIVAEIPDGESGPLDQANQIDEARVVHELINKMPSERDKAVLLRFYINKEDKGNICSDLNLSSIHFNRVLFRAKRRFKELLVQFEKNDGERIKGQ